MAHERIHDNPARQKITHIEQQKRSNQRYNIYVDHTYAFSVHEDVLVRYRLLKGRTIEQNEWEQIVREEEKKKIEQVGLRYLSYRPRTVKEVEDHLRQKDYDSGLIAECIEKWQSQGYVDDRDFAHRWFRERMHTKKKGRYLLREELKQKGIAGEIIDEVMQSVDDEHEYEACFTLAQKRFAAYAKDSEWDRKRKLFHYLQRRGFSIDLIREVYAQLRQYSD